MVVCPGFANYQTVAVGEYSLRQYSLSELHRQSLWQIVIWSCAVALWCGDTRGGGGNRTAWLCRIGLIMVLKFMVEGSAGDPLPAFKHIFSAFQLYRVSRLEPLQQGLELCENG